MERVRTRRVMSLNFGGGIILRTLVESCNFGASPPGVMDYALRIFL
jgi:hypothetical protein